ncbi:hypothetical protein Aoki45_26100 [Algoriphagus sp. oki45]|uniref:hypothetical protein n=1 Tax=Algoriphagus sp. oki45 TaxID=3067294 RepID=UPI0028003E98|nr:hypothetical protein Aoki45_26100 [Algoriphagus sp. oki45]
MKERIEHLAKKYWNAESTLEEERELKELLKNEDGFEQEKYLFGILNRYSSAEPKHIKVPSPTRRRMVNLQWLGWAASLVLLVSSVWIWRDYEQKQEQREAYEQVTEALALIQSNLSKGKEQMAPLQDLKYLNTTNQLFNPAP